jgi:hypothetical protein
MCVEILFIRDARNIRLGAAIHVKDKIINDPHNELTKQLSSCISYAPSQPKQIELHSLYTTRTASALLSAASYWDFAQPGH